MNSSQLLILGNGFDLHCGLASAYEDFFRSEILDTTTEPFGLKQLQAGVSGFWEALLLEHYKINGKCDQAWCDIEAIIRNTLLLIYFGENSGEMNIHKGLYSYATKFLNNCAAGLNLDKLCGIEKFIFEFCVKFIVTNGGKFRESLSLFTNTLLQQLNNLERRFCKYLKSQIIAHNNFNNLNQKYILKSVNLLAELTGFVHYKFRKINDFTTIQHKRELIDVFDNLSDVYVLSFNYTSLFDILDVEKPCKYSNVHGKLCNHFCAKDCKVSSVIFGIDDNLIQSHPINSELRVFSKTYRKMFSNEDPIKILPPKDNNQIRIKFYGHSLSEADYSYFQSIFDYYDLYGNSNVSLTFYYSNGYEQHDAIYKLISEYGKSLTNKEQGKNLIHKLLLENRLQIQEIKE